MKSLVVALLLVALVHAWLWPRVRGQALPTALLAGVDALLLGVALVAGGDAVLAILGGLFLLAVAPVIVRELHNHDHPETLKPDRGPRSRAGP